MLRRGRRLVTLLGPAGVGKTRAALELVSAARDAFPGGVHVVDLAPLARPDDVVNAVAAAVDVPEDPDVPLIDSLAEALHDRRVLIVLDNCEHLVAACGDLAVALLQRCPAPQILATSREVLRQPGEMVVPVEPLPAAEALDLFADRALSAAPSFALTRENRTVARAICRRLDYLPLAIELAARLVRLLPLEDILAGLNARFELLTAGSRSADDKHRDLYAAIDWSYNLLDADEQALFRRLAVLPGGFDVDLAGAVSADLDLPVIELIASMESKSLLAPMTGTPGRPRFRLLESVRAFARDRLVESGEWDLAADRLVEALTVMATPMVERFVAPPSMLSRFGVEHDNLLSAVDYLSTRTDVRELLLVAALHRCRTQRGIMANSRDQLKHALRLEDAPAAYLTVALDRSAWTACIDNDEETALALAQRACELARDAGPAMRCRTLNTLAYAYQVSGDYAAARATFESCLAEAREIGEPAGVGISLHNLAWAALLDDDLHTAAALVEEAMPIYRKKDEAAGLASFLHTAGVVEMERGNTGAADVHFISGLRNLGDARTLHSADLLEGLAITAIKGGRPERGLRLVGAAQSMRRTSTVAGDHWWMGKLACAVDEARSQLGKERAEATLQQGRTSPRTQLMEYALRPAQTALTAQPSATPLSKREREVAALVAQGSTNPEIAEQLMISERTVVSHLEHVRTKLDLRSRTQVAVWAAKHLIGA